MIMATIAFALILPHIFGYKTYAVLSGSMEPNLRVGSMAYVCPSSPDKLYLGDIITYRIGGDDSYKVVTHRLVKVYKDEEQFITKGDANHVEDGPVAFGQLIGRMCFSIPYLGYIIIYMRTGVGIKLVGVLLGIIALLNTIPQLSKRGMRKRV